MCGIVGAFSTTARYYKSPLVSFFRQALFADTFRGEDSTGIAVMAPKDEQPSVYKKALAAPDFLQLKRVEMLLDPSVGGVNWMLGHNRAATKGGVSHETAHPFQEGTITMVHNGTVVNHRELQDGQNYTVDSEAICHSLYINGLDETVKTLNGAFTLVWHDSSDDSLNIIRNEERPLWIAVAEGSEDLLMASEGSMIQWLAGRNAIKTSKIFQPNPGQHYKYYVGQEKEWANKPTVREVALRPKPAIGYNANGGNYSTTTSSYRNTGASSPKETICKRLNGALSNMGSWELIVTPLEFTANRVILQNKGEEGTITFRVVGANSTNTEINMYSVPKTLFDQMAGKAVIVEVSNAFYETGGGKARVIVNSNVNSMSIFDDPLITKNLAKEAQDTTSKKLEENLDKELDTKQSSREDIVAYKAIDVDQELKEAEFRIYEGPNQRLYTEKAMQELLRAGCFYCTMAIPLTDVEDGYCQWFGDYPVCDNCISTEMVGGAVH